MNGSVHELRAEMISTVLEISALAGTVVRAGDMVVLLESMKMEIPVLTEIDGTVEDVLVRPGDSVSATEVLAVVRR